MFHGWKTKKEINNSRQLLVRSKCGPKEKGTKTFLYNHTHINIFWFFKMYRMNIIKSIKTKIEEYSLK